MSQTETKVMSVQQKTPALNLTELRTVKWVQSTSVVKQTYSFSEDKYKTAKKRIPFLYWILASIEMVAISMLLFIHSLPWPNFILEIIYRVDNYIERTLEAIANKIEWWWDVFVVRFMWFRESLESLVDAILSFGLYIVYKIMDTWMWTVSLSLRILHFIFSPLIRILQAILPPSEKKPKPSSSDNSGAQVSANDSSAAAQDFPAKKRSASTEPEDQERSSGERYSGSTSECESEVSVVSESWSIGHTDKFGKSYNKVEMKATAEGRLRAAMYKRVKSQLSLMRKNSVCFSRGMTSYVRLLVEPRVAPFLISLKTWLRNLAAKYGLADAYDRISEWVERHYFLSLLVYFAYSALMVPFNILNKVLGRKKKSRRTRSMRSESLRRRGATGNHTPNLESYGLIKSKEPVVVEEPEYCSLRRLEKPHRKDEEDSLRDSALASSTDDLCQTSDSNDSPNSNHLKEQTIVEEEPKDLWSDRVKECIIKNQKQEVASNELSLPKVTVSEPQDEEQENHVQAKTTGIESRKSVPNAPADLSEKSSRANSGDEKVLERRHSDGIGGSPEINARGARKDQLSSPKLNQRSKNGPGSPLTRRAERIHETYAYVAKSEENLSSKEDSDKNGGKTTKRKISFSIDSMKNSE